MKLKIFDTEQDFIKGAGEVVARVCRKRGSIAIALSGGSTPQAFYKALAKRKDLPFKRITFYQVDERYVPPTHHDSNQKMIRKNLKSFYHFETQLSISGALKNYETLLKCLPGKKFDLVILGIGSDGHFASLFPQSKALKAKKLVAHTTTTKFPVKDRLTLTLSPILKSKNILVLLKGKEKDAILKELEQGRKTFQQFPAKILMKHKALTIYFKP